MWLRIQTLQCINIRLDLIGTSCVLLTSFQYTWLIEIIKHIFLLYSELARD